MTSGVPPSATRSKKESVASASPRSRLQKTTANSASIAPASMAARTASNIARDPGPRAVVNQPMRSVTARPPSLSRRAVVGLAQLLDALLGLAEQALAALREGHAFLVEGDGAVERDFAPPRAAR